MVVNTQNAFGINVWWTVPEAKKEGTIAQALLEKYGFDENMLPMPSRRTEVSRAATSFQNRRSRDNRRVTEKAADSSQYVVYGILDRGQKGEKVDYHQTTTIKFEKQSEVVNVEGTLKNEFMERLKSYRGKITDDDVRSFLREVITMSMGIPKRPSGGMYFIPGQFADTIERAQDFLDELNMGAKLYTERIMDGSQERANVWGSFEDAVDSKIEQTLKAVSRVEKRVSSINNHQSTIKELEGLMEVYSDLLGDSEQYEAISEKLNEAADEVAGKMSNLQKQAANKTEVIGANGTEALNAVYEVLVEAGEPMHYKAIAEKAVENGLKAQGKNRANYINTWLSKALKANDERFERTSRGMYAAVKAA